MRGARPPVLDVALVALGLISAVQLVVGVAGRPALLLGVALNLVLLLGLRAGHRWAYVLTLLFAFGSPVLLASAGAIREALVVLLVNCLVAIPVIRATPWFWPPDARSPRANPLYCPQCGLRLPGLAEPRCPQCGKQFVS